MSEIHHNDRIVPLTRREWMVLRLLCSDLSYREIGTRLGTTKGTVGAWATRLYLTLGTHSRIGACMAAIRVGWITLADAMTDPRGLSDAALVQDRIFIGRASVANEPRKPDARADRPRDGRRQA